MSIAIIEAADRYNDTEVNKSGAGAANAMDSFLAEVKTLLRQVRGA